MTTNAKDDSHGQYSYILLGLSADIGFVCNDAIVQYIQTLGMHVGQLTFFRLLLTAVICAAYQYRKDKTQLNLFRPELHLVWIRGLIDVTSLTSIYQSFAYMPLSNVVSLLQLRPFVVGILCLIVLGEAFTWRQVVACGISVFAVMLVLQPEFLFTHNEEGNTPPQHDTLFAVALAMIGIVLQSISALILRRVGQIDSNIILLIYGLSGCIVSPIWGLVFHQPIVAFTGYLVLLIIAITVGGFVAQMAYVGSLKRAEAAKIACLSYSQIIWSVILQSVVIKVIASFLAMIGMSIIIAAGVWVVVSVLKTSNESLAELQISAEHDPEPDSKDMAMKEFEQESLLASERDEDPEADMRSLAV